MHLLREMHQTIVQAACMPLTPAPMLLTNLRLSAACMLLTVACFGYYGPAARVLPAPTEMGLSCSAHQRWSVRYIVPHA